jgi:hypothetical protein
MRREDKKSMVKRDKLRRVLARRFQFSMINSDARFERPEEDLLCGQERGVDEVTRRRNIKAGRQKKGVRWCYGHSFSP